jgi:hypothetical protein
MRARRRPPQHPSPIFRHQREQNKRPRHQHNTTHAYALHIGHQRVGLKGMAGLEPDIYSLARLWHASKPGGSAQTHTRIGTRALSPRAHVISTDPHFLQDGCVDAHVVVLDVERSTAQLGFPVHVCQATGRSSDAASASCIKSSFPVLERRLRPQRNRPAVAATFGGMRGSS